MAEILETGTGYKFLDDFVYGRRANDQNTVALVTGKVGSGKSVAAMVMAKHYDCSWTVDRIYWSSKTFLDALPHLPEWSWVVLDEGGVTGAIAHRQFMSPLNMAIVSLMESWRFLHISAAITVPSPSYIDKVVKELCTLQIHMVFRNKYCSKGKVYELSKSVFSDKLWHNDIGEVTFWKPDESLIEEYKKKREVYMRAKYAADLAALTRQEDEAKMGKMTVDSYAIQIKRNLDRYYQPHICKDGSVGEYRFNAHMIAQDLNISPYKAYQAIGLVKNEMASAKKDKK